MMSVVSLVKTQLDSLKVSKDIGSTPLVKWSQPVFGPWQIVCYIEGEDLEVINTIEHIRAKRAVNEVDARMVKVLPEDKDLVVSFPKTPQKAVLLINVNYKEEKERIVTLNLRKIPGVSLSRAMWGPTDIIAFVEAEDKEKMRNLICDEIKTQKGEMTNKTLN